MTDSPADSLYLMQVESRKFKFLEFAQEWHTNLKSVSTERRVQLYNMCRKGDPIIIDFGCDTIKAGYPMSSSPEMVFKPLVSKNKQSTSGSFVNTIDFSYQQLDIFKSNFRSVYERNIVDHFSLYEHCNDFVFSELGCTQESISNPLVITEAPANPNYCRQQMIELYFECYNIDELFVGIDALFAYFAHIGGDLERYQRETKLVIGFGGSTTHVIPIVKGQVDFQAMRRLNVGGNHGFQTIAKLVTLKNPELKPYLNYPFLKLMYNRLSVVSLDYRRQLAYFMNAGQAEPSKFYKNMVEEQNKHMVEPFDPVVPVEIVVQKPENQVSVQEQRRRQEIKHRMTERLKEAIQRKRDQKARIHQADYEELLAVKKRYEQDPDNANEELTEMFGQNKPLNIMNKKIKLLQSKLNIQSKDVEEKKFALLDIPDSELSPDKLRLKRLQQYQKQAYQKRQQKLLEKEEEERKMKQLREENPEEYISQLKSRYSVLSSRIKQAQRIKEELSNRNSSLNRKRLQTMIQMEDQKDEENFGENDEDWQVYKTEEEADHQSQLQAIEEELRDVDPSWMQNTDKHHLNTGNLVYLSTELVKGPQCLFDPSMVGIDQVGIPNTVYSSLKYYSPDVVKELLGSVLLVGGGSQLKGLKERLHKQLVATFQAGIDIRIEVAREAQNGAFCGMQMLCSKHPQYVKEHSMTKVQYQSKKIKSQQHLFNKIVW